MHPDIAALAAYLDGVGAQDERAALRAHILTCPACAARLERLRADARLISDALAAPRQFPDVRGNVRARLRRRSPMAWLGPGVAAAGALAALLLFAVLLGGGTAGRAPDRLFVTDRHGGRVVALDAHDGARLAAAAVGEAPTSICYDAARDRLYVMLRDSIAAVDPRTLQAVDRWIAPQPLSAQPGMALDARRARLYVAQPGGIVVLALDRPGLSLVDTIALSAAPSGLAVAPNGKTLYALAPDQGRLWTIAVDGDTIQPDSLALAEPGSSSLGYLALSRDGASIYVLLTGAADGRPTLWRVEPPGRVAATARLAERPLPWDVETLDTGQVAIPRGDGATGGVELVDGRTLATVARLDPQRDQHHVAAGPSGAAFGLNFTSEDVTRFDTRQRAIVWRTPASADWQPWDAVYVPGGWRWPF